VPRAKLACGRAGVDGDGMVVQSGRLALRLLSWPAACMGCQLVRLHGEGNQSPTRRSGDVRAPGSCCMSWPTPSQSRGELARDKDSSCEAETCHARRRVVVRGGDLSEGVPPVGN
jgi:hypothetical protein